MQQQSGIVYSGACAAAALPSLTRKIFPINQTQLTMLNGSASWRAALAAAVCAAVFAPGAHALGLGQIEVRSALHQRFLGWVALSAAPDEDPGCLVARADASQDLPGLKNPRLVLVEENGRKRIEVSSSAEVVDPVIKVTVSVGCLAPVSRTYTLFIDPPRIEPAAPAIEVLTAAPPEPPATMAVPTPPLAVALEPQGAVPANRAVARRAAVRPRRAPSAPIAGPIVPRVAGAPTGDRVRLEAAGPGANGGAAQVVADLRGERDRLMAELDAANKAITTSEREVALQKQLVVLSRESEKLRVEMDALTAALRERESAFNQPWWVWLLGGLGLLVAIAALLSLRRRGESPPWWSSRAARDERADLDRTWEPVASVLPNGRAKDIDKAEMLKAAQVKVVAAALARQERDELEGALPAAAVVEERHDEAAIQMFRQEPTAPVAPAPVAVMAAEGPAAPAPAPARATTAIAQYAAKTNERETIHMGSEALQPVGFDFILPPVEAQAKSAPAVPLQKPVVAAPVAPPADEHVIEFAALDFDIDAPAPAPAAPASTTLHMPFSLVPVDSAPLAPAEIEGVRARLIHFASQVAEVEELVARNEDALAIALLRRHVLRDENTPTLMWLQLLELYRKVGKSPVYAALSEHFAKRYERPMIAWEESLADRTPQLSLTERADLVAPLRAARGSVSGLARLNALICGRTQSDDVVFNAALQRDLLRFAADYPTVST